MIFPDASDKIGVVMMKRLETSHKRFRMRYNSWDNENMP